MYTSDELEWGLKSIVTKVEDLDSVFEDLRGDKKLSGIKSQAEFLIDIMKRTDILMYSYHRYFYVYILW